MLSSIISGSPPRCAVIAERQGTPGARAHLPVSGELFKMMTGVSLVHVPYRGAGPAFVDLFEDQLAMLLEYAEASFECMEHRFRQLRGLACVKRVLQEYALANDVGLQFGDVPVGLVKMRLQQYIPGRPSNRAVICCKGKVLAGISVEVVELNHEYGPASVVRLIDHPEMAMVAEHMVECLNWSGFVGFDFVLDSSNQAWLIEMNPRVTPISHFSLANGTT